MAKTTDAIKILDQRTGDDPELRALVEQATLNAQVAQLIYDARIAAGLTQKELADRIGTKQPVIARLENADYEGHSLSMLQKIASALKMRVEIAFTPATEALQPS